MPASPIPTWLLLLLMAFGAKRQRVDHRGPEAAQARDGDECKGRDGEPEGFPFSTADHKQRRESNGVGNGLKLIISSAASRTALGTVSSGIALQSLQRKQAPEA
jgi:hypothetical protein